ncbi:hypothetical protein SAMN05444337_1533 [Flavobacterium haoranii]|uniref:Uncharacterized protein n=2 Tax=Flavobacterium haoranii TaxID=683124 RepID=A0A1M6HFT5_9FLAO|nr:hypothetical protein SAMN05444337_1533 [Flavobacterium haoranii]
MKMTLHKILCTAFLLITITLAQKTFANAAQPGIWNAGGTVYTMLYPEDANTFKKVQMQQERIFIQLYKGFAVVKGTYVFKNTTNEHLQFKMGYPINGIYSGGENDLNQIILDSLSQFKIKANNKWLLLEQENHPEINTNTQNINAFSDNWKVWQMQFAPNEIQKVEVYFIVNTNEARIRKGYNIEKRNAFIYLLESGSVWKNNIEKGEFYIQLMDGLTPENVQGISNGFGFKFNTQYQIFVGQKTNFSPTPKDNLIINYSEFNENFSFENVIKQTNELFAKIDQMSQLSFESLTYSNIELGNPYEVESTIEGTLPGLLTLFVIFAPFIIGFIGIGIAIWVIVKWIRLKKKIN